MASLHFVNSKGSPLLVCSKSGSTRVEAARLTRASLVQQLASRKDFLGEPIADTDEYKSRLTTDGKMILVNAKIDAYLKAIGKLSMFNINVAVTEADEKGEIENVFIESLYD